MSRNTTGFDTVVKFFRRIVKKLNKTTHAGMKKLLSSPAAIRTTVIDTLWALLIKYQREWRVLRVVLASGSKRVSQPLLLLSSLSIAINSSIVIVVDIVIVPTVAITWFLLFLLFDTAFDTSPQTAMKPATVGTRRRACRTKHVDSGYWLLLSQPCAEPARHDFSRDSRNVKPSLRSHSLPLRSNRPRCLEVFRFFRLWPPVY